MAYRIARLLLHLLFRLIARIEMYGVENVPPEGNYIGVSNHIGRLDPGLVYYLLNRKDIIMMVAEKYRQYAPMRWLVRVFDGIWVDRYNADFNAMRVTLRRLQKGGVLAVAPEGTRSPSGKLLPGRDGASYLAAKSGLLVVPVGLVGTEDAVVKSRLKRFNRLNITIRVGKPFWLPPLPVQAREQVLKCYTEEIMCRIAVLLPASQRGFYAENPRLKEFLPANELAMQATSRRVY